MGGSCRAVRLFAIRAALAVAAAIALVRSADAQWFPPFGAAPPAEIVQRLRAEGYVLVGPLQRRDTVYLADVSHGPHGRERLVVDAWSGEILQRFLVRRRGYVPEGGEFSEPRPLGPPPPRAFGEGNFEYGPGPGGYEAPPRAKSRSKPGVARRGGEPKAKPVGQENVGSENPAAAAPAAAPAAASTSPTASPSPSPAVEPAKEALPATAPSPAEAKEAAPPAPAPGGKGEKKLNDVPVNPLD
jgi:hypothetical protein